MRRDEVVVRLELREDESRNSLRSSWPEWSGWPKWTGRALWSCWTGRSDKFCDDKVPRDACPRPFLQTVRVFVADGWIKRKVDSHYDNLAHGVDTVFEYDVRDVGRSACEPAAPAIRGGRELIVVIGLA